jgi:hypothetical protein
MTQVASTQLGESLGTDFFSVREQFTDSSSAAPSPASGLSHKHLSAHWKETGS